MKLFTFLLAMLFSLTSVYAQDQDKLDKSIDSLNVVKADLEKQLGIINNKIRELENLKKELILKNILSEGFLCTLKREGKLKDKPEYDGNIIRLIKAEEEVLVLGYEKSYFLIKNENDYGYIQEMFFEPLSKELEGIKASGQSVESQKKAQKEAQRIADMKIESERQKQIETEKKAEDEKQEAIAAEKRKKALIAKYGQVIGLKILDSKIWIGMTKEMALESWGKPENINRTVNANSVQEQWVYGIGTYLYFEDGILTTWQD